jgi:hypothetical protein
MDSIEIKKEQLASVEPTQVLHCKKPTAPPSENTNSEEAIDVDQVMFVKNSDNNLMNSPNMLPDTSPRDDTDTSDDTSTTMDTDKALKNAIDDSTTQSFGTDASKVGTE